MLKNEKYQLSPAIKFVDGVRSWCVMNLDRGEFVLVNQSAAEILMEFSKETKFKHILDSKKIPEALQKSVLDFLKTCIDSEILLCADSLKCQKTLRSQRTRHISAKTLSIVLELSTMCNLSCRHCYNNSGPKNVSALSLSEVKKLFSDLKTAHNNLATLTITGGEPFLYQDLFDVLCIAKTCGFPIIRINTNGTILPKVNISKIDHNLLKLITIQVTILGSNEKTHDELSRTKGSFSKTVENIGRYQDLGFKVGISFIRSKYSEHEIDDALQLGKKLGIKVILGDIFPLGRAASDFDNLGINSTKRKMLVVCDSNYYEGKRAGILSEDKRLSAIESFPPEIPCGKNTVAISSNGDVLPCMLLQGIVVGNIYQKSLTEIMYSPTMIEFREKAAIENRQSCSKCELRYACSNKCPAVSLSHSGDITKKNPYCSYY